MSEAQQSIDAKVTRAKGRSRDLRVILLQVAWMSIVLGILMEALLVVARFASVTEAAPLIADLTQKIAWSFVVCMGLGVGAGVAQANPPVMGLAGMVAAPSAFYISRGLHNGVAELLGSEATNINLTPVVIPLLRGVEYLCLGLIIGWLAQRVWGGAGAHIGAGLLVGLVFGAIVFAVNPASAASTVALVSFAVNELLFPVGCSLILFVSNSLAKRLET